MAGRGPTPKDPDQRRRRNGTPELTVIVTDGKVRGPKLPATHEWPPQTVAWWETWRTSAQAAKFTKTDWAFLLDTAVLHADFWLGDRSVAAELRLRAAKFGATPEDRARLKIEVGDPGEKKSPAKRLQPKATQTRRTRLLRAVGDDGGEGSD